MSRLQLEHVEVVAPLSNIPYMEQYKPIGCLASHEKNNECCKLPVDTTIWWTIIALYLVCTALELIRAIMHTFLYKSALNDISGLATGDALCDNRLSAIMIAYGGANLESFLVRTYILAKYAFCECGLDLVCFSSLVAALWYPVVMSVSSMGKIDVGDADIPGKDIMLARSVLSLCTGLLTIVLYYLK